MSPFVTLISLIRRSSKGSRGKALLTGFIVWFAGAVVLWYLLPYQPRFTLPSTENSVAAGFSPDGKILATKLKPAYWPNSGRKHGDENGPVHLWDVDTGEEIGHFSTNGRFADHIEFSSDGTILVIGSLSPDGGERTYSIIERKTCQALASIQGGTQLDLNCLTPDGKTFLFTPPGHELGRAKLWDIPAGSERLTLDCWPACFSPDGEWFLTMESGTQIKFRSTATGLCLRTIPLTSKAHECHAITISPGGALVLGHLYTAVKVWDPSTGQEIASLARASNPRFSHNGKRLAARIPEIGAGTYKLWNTASWQELTDFNLPPPSWNWQSILAGPGPEDLRIAVIKNRGSSPGPVERWMAAHLSLKNLQWPKCSTT